MLGLSPWISLLAVLIVALAARMLPPIELQRIRRALDSGAAPWVVGVLSAVGWLWVWGTLTSAPVMHDEVAYLLQAELFAKFRWTGVGPPLPEFFRQLYVLVDPVLASKYPPGNSLLLSLGAIFGVPGLPVIVINGVSASLIFVLARRFGGSVVALLTWVLWISSFPILYFHATYMSEGVTSLAWLATWWGIVRWRDGAGRNWLVLAAVATAWCVITRPLTGLALTAVALIVVARRCRANHTWRNLLPAAAAGALVLAVLPLWNWRTTGNALSSPLSTYTQSFVPFDKPGFGARPNEKPSAKLPRDQWITSASFYQEHERHTFRALPAIAWQRLTMIDRDMSYEWRAGLRVFALIGLFALSIEGWVALIAFATQFFLYLSYAHPPGWTIYYIECMPVIAFITALGISSLLRAVTARQPHSNSRIAIGVLPLCGGAAVACVITARQVRSQIESDHRYYSAFTAMVERVPDKPAVVFVRYADKHPDGISLVRNVADLRESPVWIVYDRGAQNERLVAVAPDRAAYLFDENDWTLRRLDAANAPTRPETSAIVPAGTPRELRGAQRPH